METASGLTSIYAIIYFVQFSVHVHTSPCTLQCTCTSPSFTLENIIKLSSVDSSNPTFEQIKKDGYCEKGLKREEVGDEWLKVLDID